MPLTVLGTCRRLDALRIALSRRGRFQPKCPRGGQPEHRADFRPDRRPPGHRFRHSRRLRLMFSNRLRDARRADARPAQHERRFSQRRLRRQGLRDVARDGHHRRHFADAAASGPPFSPFRAAQILRQSARTVSRALPRPPARLVESPALEAAGRRMGDDQPRAAVHRARAVQRERLPPEWQEKSHQLEQLRHQLVRLARSYGEKRK